MRKAEIYKKKIFYIVRYKIMTKTLRAKLGKGVVDDMVDRLKSGIRPVLKFTADQAKDTLQDAGDVSMKFLDSQLTKLRNAVRSGKGIRFTLTQKQTDDMVKEGGFLGAMVGPAVAGLAGSVLPSIVKGLKGKGVNNSENDHFRMYSGKEGKMPSLDGQGLSLGNGLFLRPMQQGSGFLDTAFPGVQEIHDDIVGIIQKGALNQGIKGMGMVGGMPGIPITRKGISNIIKKLSPTAVRIGEKVLVDQIKGKGLSVTPQKNGSMVIKYGPTQHKVSGGFLGNLIKSVGNIIPF